jgi:hypothetical protein
MHRVACRRSLSPTSLRRKPVQARVDRLCCRGIPPAVRSLSTDKSCSPKPPAKVPFLYRRKRRADPRVTEACREHKRVVVLASIADGRDARGGFTLIELLVVITLLFYKRLHYLPLRPN